MPHIVTTMKGFTPHVAALMAQATVSNKSSIPQTILVIEGGVAVIIQNNPSLSSDQMPKYKHEININDIAIKFDEINNSI